MLPTFKGIFGICCKIPPLLPDKYSTDTAQQILAKQPQFRASFGQNYSMNKAQHRSWTRTEQTRGRVLPIPLSGKFSSWAQTSKACLQQGRARWHMHCPVWSSGPEPGGQTHFMYQHFTTRWYRSALRACTAQESVGLCLRNITNKTPAQKRSTSLQIS